MRLISYLWRHSKHVLALAVLAGLVSGASTTGLLALINSALSGSLPRLTLVWSFALLCLLVPAARIASELLLARLGQDTIMNLRLQLSRRVLAVPLRRLEQLGHERILSALTEDVFAVTNAVSQIPVLCINLTTVLGALLYLGWLSWEILLIVLVFIVVGVAGYQWPVVKAVHYMRRASSLHDVLFGHFQALTAGAKELKLNRQRNEAFLEDELGATTREYRNQILSGSRILTIASSWGQLLLFVTVGILLFGSANVEGRVLTGYALTLLYLMNPLQMLLNAGPAFTRAGVALQRLREMGVVLDANANREHIAAGTIPVWEQLDLVGAVHTYRRENEPGDFTLGPIDLTLGKKEIVFITGGNGSGKTTLAKLLTGLYAPESGEMLWNGAPVTDENRDAFRQNFSAVFSDFHLFGSLLGLDEARLDERARDYLERLHLEQKVTVDGGRLSTLNVSQGQRKRLALLTAYLENRAVYLFDEWAADQDPMFKEVFYRQILPELKLRNKTAIVISHDDRYYDIADRVIKLENGQITTEVQQIAGSPLARSEAAYRTAAS